MKSQQLIEISRVSMLAALIYLFTTSTVWAATFYIDYQSGNNTNNGTTTLTPWKNCPGDPRATNNANITLSPGDTVVFKGGVTYSFTSGATTDYIEANASGSPGNVITYISGHVHSSSWGTGRAVIDGTEANPSYPSHTGVLGLGSHSYITIRGLEVKNLPLIDASLGLIAWSGTSGGNIIIDDNKIHNSGGNGIKIQGEWAAQTPAHFIIRNNDVTLTNYHGVMVRYGVNDVLIENNTFDLNGVQVYAGTYEGDCVSLSYDVVGGGGSIQTNVIIRGNDFNDTAEDNPNYIPTKSHILVQQDTIGTIIENNYFHGKPKYSSIDFAGPQTDITIRNNVFNVYVVTWQGALSFETDQGAGVLYNGINIFNNTFVAEPGSNRGVIFFGKGNSTQLPMFTNVDIRNNIIDMDTDINDYLIYIDTIASAPVVQLSTLIIDYNVYQSGKSTSFYSNGTAYNFANWKTYLSNNGVSGADAHSNTGQVTFNDELNKNYTLSSNDSKALNKGIDLSGKGLAHDKDGTARPQGAAWEIGAYESIVPSPPTNLHFVE